MTEERTRGGQNNWVPRTLGGLVACAGGCGMLGWLLAEPRLVGLGVSDTAMAVNTALGFVAFGLALMASTWRQWWVVRIGGTVVLGLGLLAVLQRSGWPLRGDPLIFFPARGAMPASGRVAVFTAWSFVVLGALLWLLTIRGGNRWRLTTVGGTLVLALAVLSMGGAAFGWDRGVQQDLFNGMAPVTAAVMLLAVLGLLHRLWRDLSPWAQAQSRVLASFTFAGTLLVVVGVTAWSSNQHEVQADERAEQSQQIIEWLDHAELELTRMESAARAYVLAQVPGVLTPYRQAEVRLHALRWQLRARLAEDVGQKERFAQFDALILAKCRYMAGIIEQTRRRAGLLNPEDYRLPQGPALMAQVRMVLAQIENVERSKLELAHEQAEADVERTGKIILVGNGFAILLALFALRTIQKSDRARNRVARELETTASRLGEAQRIAHLGNWEFRPEVREQEWWSAELYRLLGLDPAIGVMTTDRFYAHVHPEDRVRVKAEVDAAISGGSGFTLEYRVIRADGEVRHFRDVAQPARDDSGRVVLLRGVMQDITERKQAELALRELEERWQFALEGSAYGVWDWNGETNTIFHSPTWKRLFGYMGHSAAQLQDWHRRVHPDDLPGVLASLQRHHDRQTEIFEHEYRLRTGTGAYVWVLDRGKVVKRDATGRPLRMIGTHTDVTERRNLLESLAQARDAALEASRLKSEFLANMSHEIRTPMNGILGMSSLLLDSPLNADQIEMARVIRNSGDLLLRIISDILDLSKIEAGKLRLEPVDFEPVPLVEESVALLAPQAREKKLELVSQLDPGLPARLFGDAARIRQVLLNLLGNAIKFTEAGSVRVEASARHTTDTRCVLRIEVADTGIGIARAQQGRLFQPFMQADNTTTRRYGGTGLGLAIARQLLTAMGGEIGFTSEEGRGSCFWFQLDLPVGRTNSRPPMHPPAAAGVAPVRAAHLLVAEDNDSNQRLIRLVLEHLGHTCTIVGDGEAALQMLARDRFDAVLMDCQMPGMDGYTATQRIRAGAVPGLDRNLPIVAVTAYAMADDRLKCLAAGMNAYLAKPVQIAELAEALSRQGIGSRGHAAEPVAVAAIALPEGVIDATQIATLRSLPGRKHPSLLADLCEMFAQETPGRLAELRQLADQHAAEQLAFLAHKLAGSSANLGGRWMREAALELERVAQAGDWAAVPGRLAALDREWERLRHALETLMVSS